MAIAVRPWQTRDAILGVDEHQLDEVGLLPLDARRPDSIDVLARAHRLKEAAIQILVGHAAVGDIPADQRRWMTARRGEASVREQHVDGVWSIDQTLQLRWCFRHVRL